MMLPTISAALAMPPAMPIGEIAARLLLARTVADIVRGGVLGPGGFGFELLADLGRLAGGLGNELVVGAAVGIAGPGLEGRPFDKIDEAVLVIGALLFAGGLQLLEFGPLLFLALLDLDVSERALVVELLAGRVLALARGRALLIAQGVAGFRDLLLGGRKKSVAVGKHLPGGGEIILARKLHDLAGEVRALALGLAADGIGFPEMLHPTVPELFPHLAVGGLPRLAELLVPGLEERLALLLVAAGEHLLLAGIERHAPPASRAA